MTEIKSIEALEALYGQAVPQAITKVANVLTPLYQQWISASRFVVIATVGPNGTDASPRGDNEPVVRIVDEKTLHLPDWRGNNRLDSLRNIVLDGRISLMFMVPGCKNVVRINGSSILSADPMLTESFERRGKSPQTVIVVKVEETYFQCAKAIMRSGLWDGEDGSSLVPSAGDFLKEVTAGFDAKSYDEGYAQSAQSRMW